MSPRLVSADYYTIVHVLSLFVAILVFLDVVGVFDVGISGLHPWGRVCVSMWW
jgi:hypothetical protein